MAVCFSDRVRRTLIQLQNGVRGGEAGVAVRDAGSILEIHQEHDRVTHARVLGCRVNPPILPPHCGCQWVQVHALHGSRTAIISKTCPQEKLVRLQWRKSNPDPQLQREPGCWTDSRLRASRALGIEACRDVSVLFQQHRWHYCDAFMLPSELAVLAVRALQV